MGGEQRVAERGPLGYRDHLTPGYELLTENLRRLTEMKKIPLTALADRAGIDRAELFAAMAGEVDPDLDWLNKLADTLGVHVSELLEEPRPKPRPS